GLIGHAHGFHVGQTGVGHVQQSVFLGPVHGHLVGAATAVVYEFDFDFLSNTFEPAITPDFKRVSFRLPAAFFRGTLIRAAHGVGIDAIGLAVHDVDPTAISAPARHAGGEVLIGIGDAPVVLFFVLVFRSVGCGITATPEIFNEG